MTEIKEMPTELGILLGKVLEGQNRVKEDIRRMEDKSDAARRNLYESVNHVRDNVAAISQGQDTIHRRLEGVEKAIAKAEPDLIEFRAMKQRVKGAGMLGKTIWTVGGVLVAAGGWLLSNLVGK